MKQKEICDKIHYMKKANRKSQQYQQTHRMIYICFSKLLEEENYEKITIRQICDACGISIGSFYNHFSGKSDILNEGYLLFDESVQKELENRRVEESAKERVLHLFELELSLIEKSGVAMTSSLFIQQMSFADPNILHEDRYFYQELLRSLKDYIAEKGSGADPIKSLSELLRVSRGTIYDWCLHKGNYSLAEETLPVIRRLLECL